jgi:hypothetical protein
VSGRLCDLIRDAGEVMRADAWRSWTDRPPNQSRHRSVGIYRGEDRAAVLWIYITDKEAEDAGSLAVFVV